MSVKLGALDSDGDFEEKKKDKHFFDAEEEGQALQFTFSVSAQDVSDYAVQIDVGGVTANWNAADGGQVTTNSIKITESGISTPLYETDNRGTASDDN